MRGPILALLWLCNPCLLVACGDDSGSVGPSEAGDADGTDSPGDGDGDGDGDASALDPIVGKAGDPAPFECGADGSDWLLAWQQLECEVIDLVNGARAEGGDCGAQGVFEPAAALQPHAVLRDNARAHSQDMLDHDYFGYEESDGRGLEEWALDGYAMVGARVDIVGGHGDAQGVIDSLLESPGNCANLMNRTSRFIGVGHAAAGGDAGVTASGSKWTIITAE